MLPKSACESKTERKFISQCKNYKTTSSSVRFSNRGTNHSPFQMIPNWTQMQFTTHKRVSTAPREKNKNGDQKSNPVLRQPEEKRQKNSRLLHIVHHGDAIVLPKQRLQQIGAFFSAFRVPGRIQNHGANAGANDCVGNQIQKSVKCLRTKCAPPRSFCHNRNRSDFTQQTCVVFPLSDYNAKKHTESTYKLHTRASCTQPPRSSPYIFSCEGE